MADSQAEALRALHDEHAPALWRYVVWLCGDRELAEDIVQETLLRAWRRPIQFDPAGASARAWLFTVARNLVIDDYRSARSRHESPAADLPDRVSADQTDSVLDAWLVSDALAQLSPEHRVVVVHAYYRGLSVAAIARILEIPEGTVKSRLHYALRSMRLALQERGLTE
ncbi:MAG TPA: sigma-70 family RNA polymerase sigma factor [Homoserinimonas sp.]|nr:sigma-70 family RNA polymerase sigma factor [Homoserinimonas sp.]